MARIHQLKDVDMDNGYWGFCTSIWFNGCVHECKGCWNSETWAVNDSLYVPNEEIIEKTVEYLDNYFPKDLSILGGDPLAPFNVDDTYEILSGILEKRPQTRVVCWTGYIYEALIKHGWADKILPMIDILIDGRYIEKLHVEGKPYGSSNQRVIRLKDSLKKGKIILDEQKT